MFGWGGEEAEALAAAGIAVEVVSGVRPGVLPVPNDLLAERPGTTTGYPGLPARGLPKRLAG